MLVTVYIMLWLKFESIKFAPETSCKNALMFYFNNRHLNSVCNRITVVFNYITIGLTAKGAAVDHQRQ